MIFAPRRPPIRLPARDRGRNRRPSRRKIHYLILHPSEFPGNILSGSGLVWFGGLFGAIVAVVIVTLVRKQRLAGVMDTAAPGVAIGYVFGRLGCFLNGTTMASRPTCPGGCLSRTAVLRPPRLRVHPTQLYEPLPPWSSSPSYVGDQPAFQREGPLCSPISSWRASSVSWSSSSAQTSPGSWPHPTAVDQPLLFVIGVVGAGGSPLAASSSQWLSLKGRSRAAAKARPGQRRGHEAIASSRRAVASRPFSLTPGRSSPCCYRSWAVLFAGCGPGWWAWPPDSSGPHWTARRYPSASTGEACRSRFHGEW